MSAQPGWREIDWRGRLRQVEVGGRRVNYAEVGEGKETVVFVHGLAGCWQNWLENLPRAARERRAIALDLPGFGESEMPAEQISISGYARALDEFCERLGLGEVALVGNSMGGFIAAETAIRHPERVDRLVLVAAAGLSIANLRRRPAATWARINAVLGTYAAARSRDVATRPRLRHLALSFVMRHPTLIKADLSLEFMKGAGKPGFMDAMEAMLEYDFRDRLDDIRCPTLIVWGEDDMLVPQKDASEFARLIPTSHKVVMEDTGHVPMAERPETFNDCLEEFLAQSRERSEPTAA